ncbi:hypothetical protein ACGRT8_02070 [Candidatus Phytoplasma australasiaticum]
MIILSIETSCYETSIAITQDDHVLFANNNNYYGQFLIILKFYKW